MANMSWSVLARKTAVNPTFPIPGLVEGGKNDSLPPSLPLTPPPFNADAAPCGGADLQCAPSGVTLSSGEPIFRHAAYFSSFPFSLLFVHFLGSFYGHGG